jgi:hypothetical protein
MEDDSNNPVSEILSVVAEEMLDSTLVSDPDAVRDAWWLRWLKFASIIVVPAVILGMGFLFENYIEQSNADTSYRRHVAERQVEHDTINGMKFRFWAGASVGGGLGLIYVVRCIVRRADP